MIAQQTVTAINNDYTLMSHTGEFNNYDIRQIKKIILGC